MEISGDSKLLVRMHGNMPVDVTSGNTELELWD